MIDRFFGTPDLFGWGLAVWCTLSGCLLLSLIIGGFIGFWLTTRQEKRANHKDRPLIGTAADLSLLDLWRLSRSMRRTSETERAPAEAPAEHVAAVRSAR